MVAHDTPVSDGVSLRAMDARDLEAALALTAEVRWPHRASDWEQAFRHGEGLIAERDGKVVGTGLRWRWGPRHATLGLIIVSPSCQGTPKRFFFHTDEGIRPRASWSKAIPVRAPSPQALAYQARRSTPRRCPTR